jgi:hypothetical protein
LTWLPWAIRHAKQRHIIVSNLLSEAKMCLQVFIVKTLIIRNMNSHHIYMKWKEGAREQDAGETERVRERERIVTNCGSNGCKNGH